MKTASLMLAVLLVVLLASGQATFAYIKFGTRVNGQQVTLKWAEMPVRYFVSSRSSVPGVSIGDLEAAVQRAFGRWQAVPTTSITYRYGGLTLALPGEDDGLSTVGFASHPELDRVLGSTSFLVDRTTGAIVEADIFFNSAFPWSVAPSGEANKYDLESIALHEVGHFSGLGHSALGETELQPAGGRRVLSAEAVMFPIAFASGSIAARQPKADDMAGISDLYPGGDFSSRGSLSGRVTKNGQPLFGAHVVAFDLRTGSLVAGFALTPQGEFSIADLSPGPHVIRVEPVDDADLDAFFDSSQNVDLSFRVLLFDRLIVVPQGGDTGSVELKVVPK